MNARRWPATRTTTAAAWALVASTCLYWLVALRGERLPVTNLNDSAVHTQMIRFAGRQVSDGNWPIESWYPFFGLGSPFLQHYQSGPAVITSLLGRVVGDDVAFSWSLWLLVALWPAAVYAGARLFDCDRLTSACAAVVAPVLVSTAGYGYEHGSYTWQGYGLWAQAVGMWLLPLSWALTWRAVVGGRSLLLGAVALGATVSLHFLTGYQALLAVGIWVLIGGRRFWPRLGRAAMLGTAAVLMSAWAIVPIVVDSRYTAQSVYMVDSYFNDSFGARQILSWLVQGEVYDRDRLPVVTVLVAVGAVVCAARWRTSATSRALLSIWVFSLMLWFGRATWGRAVDVFPGSEELLFHRFNMGVHLAGVLLAGTGLAAGVQLVHRVVTKALTKGVSGFAAPASALAAAALLLVLVPAYDQIGDFDRAGTAQVQAQQGADQTDGADVERLVDLARASGTGRMYAGSRNNWGQQYRVGQVPVYAVLAALDVDAPGFTLRAPSLSADVDASFNANDPEQLRLLAVRFLIYPQTQAPPSGVRLLASAGRHRLYELSGVSGYLAVGDLVSTAATDRSTVLAQAGPYLASGASARQRYVSLEFAGDPALPVPSTLPRDGSPGRVVSEVAFGEQGRYVGRVQTVRPAAVVLKASYDGRWSARVDGQPTQVGMVSPSFVAVEVPAGTHSVEFVYVPYDQHEVLLALGLAALVALAVAQRRLKRRRPSGPITTTTTDPVRTLTRDPELAS